MTTIKSLTIEGFKSFRKLEPLELGPLNILIGANGSGKSNFLAALKLLTKACSAQQLFDHVERAGGGNRLLHYGAKTTRSIRFKLGFADGQADFTLVLRYGAEDRLFSDMRVEPGSLPPDYAERFEPQPGLVPAVEFLDLRLAGWETYHFADTTATSRVKTTPSLDDNRRLQPDGANLAAFLYLLQVRHRIAYDQIRRTVQLAAPFFDDFVLAPRALNPETIKLEWRQSPLGRSLWRFLAVGWNVAVHGACDAAPPAGRTPAQVDSARRAGTGAASVRGQPSRSHASGGRRWESQLIVATQSPLLLDQFGAGGGAW